MVESLEVKVNFRLFKDKHKLVLNYLKHNKNVFENESHFYRCAVEVMLRECERKGLRVVKNVNRR